MKFFSSADLTQPNAPSPLFQPVLPVAIAFGIASFIGGTLLVTRYLLTGHVVFLYLPWNLFLAWIPFGLAIVCFWMFESNPRRRWPRYLIGFGWLLFLPNAPHICTDLAHLCVLSPHLSAPPWFDLFLNLTFVLTGLLLGYASLAIMHSLVSRSRGWFIGWGFAVTALALAGFGIYLGRVVRWRSWDAVFSPFSLATDIADRLSAPWTHPQPWAFTFICFVFLLPGYLICHHLTRLNLEPVQRVPAQPMPEN